MSIEPFTIDPLYKVKIAHPKGDSKTVTVRALPAISGEYREALANNTEFTATLIYRDNGEVWARIVECLTKPQTEGYYCALKYPNSEGELINYANWVEVIPDNGEITLKHTIEVYSDGSITIDGNSYS